MKRERKSDMWPVTMTRATFPIAVLFLCIGATAPEVIFVSPCECQGFHGKTRWVTKTDQAPVPSDKSAIQSITPSQIYALRQRHGFEHGFPLIRSLLASAQRSTSVSFSFVPCLLIMAASFAIRQSKTILARADRWRSTVL